MRYVVTCFLENNGACSFKLEGDSIQDVSRAFEKTLREAKIPHDFVELHNGKRVKISSILAYRIDEMTRVF
ncbi:hypothetical protein [Exiguobacterium aurantiacum]|uniref:hypothetical protein n=1 Tax=Exiguobacterium aurantiacum TaxID=33987 RepID=UPI00384DE6C5